MVNLSFDNYLRGCRTMFLDAISKCKDKIKGNEEITDFFREKINWHLQCQESNWALSKEELVPFEKLLCEIESDDILIKNKYLFEDFLIKTPDYKDFDNDFLKKNKETRETRAKIIKQIIDKKGLDAVWSFAEIVKHKEGVANGIL